MLLLGDCLIQMKTLPDNSVDSVVTDPPYGLAFMGKKWDYSVPSVEIWKEVLRVLKPGGHLLSFGGTRTYHRMVVNIEDAGFEIRDQVMWLYGSGFPKSHNISIGIDKQAGAMKHRGKAFVSAGQDGRKDLVGTRGIAIGAPEPITDEAIKWDGWGSALKPANEPICLARKPLEKGLTLAQNVLKWGTGGLNIDASRVATSALDAKAMERANSPGSGRNKAHDSTESSFGRPTVSGAMDTSKGRWPANLILDEAAAELMPVENKQSVSRFFYVAKASKRERNAGLEDAELKRSDYRPGDTEGKNTIRERLHNSIPKANHHPTVKPTKLNEYLCKLITPPGGTILDPFMGSGSTGVAAVRLGFNFIGCEMNEEYYAIAQKRIEAAV